MRTLNNTLASKFGKFSIESNVIKGGDSIVYNTIPTETITKKDLITPVEGW